MGLRIRNLMPVHNGTEVAAKSGVTEHEADVGGLRVRGDGGGDVAVTVQERSKARDQRGFESGLQHLPIERFLARTVFEDLRRRKLVPEEVPHDFIVALAVHPLMHLLGSLDSVATVVFFPDDAVQGIESTITPSMSKIKARILCNGRVLRRNIELVVEPCQIIRRSFDHRQRQNFG